MIRHRPRRCGIVDPQIGDELALDLVRQGDLALVVERCEGAVASLDASDGVALKDDRSDRHVPSLDLRDRALLPDLHRPALVVRLVRLSSTRRPEHGQRARAFSDYLIEMSRDTFENWQSEFLQLIWQVVGLAFFLYVGSPSSKENDDRLEAKVDALAADQRRRGRRSR